jgi:hypothetical protein
MELLEEAIAARLGRIGQGVVYLGSAPRDTPPPYYVYRLTEGGNGMRTRNGQVTDGLVGTDYRYYLITIAAVARDPDRASAMRQAAEDALHGWSPEVAGWSVTLPVFWTQLEPDLGDLLPGGTIGYEAGDRYTANLYRART